jgi:hypothetical protein
MASNSSEALTRERDITVSLRCLAEGTVSDLAAVGADIDRNRAIAPDVAGEFPLVVTKPQP